MQCKCRIGTGGGATGRTFGRPYENMEFYRYHLLKRALACGADDAAVNEIEFGELTGLSDREIDTRYGAFMEQRRALLADLAFPGGECGADVFARAYPFLLKVAESGREHAVIVTHGGTIRALLAGVLHMEQRYRLTLTKTLENTSVTILEYNRQRNWFTVETVNDYAHLTGYPDLLRAAIKR